MLENDINLAGAFAESADAAIDNLLERIMNGENPEDARDQLRRLALQFPDDTSMALSALTYYRGMRSAISEEDFRWFSVAVPIDRRMVRKHRLAQYRRYRELFEIEIEGTRRQRAAVMALKHDWSHMGEHLKGAVRLARSRWMLRAAGILYRAGVPGALDICDAAAFDLFRAAYLQA